MTDEEFVICVANEGHLASLEPRKVYRMLSAEPHDMLRVIDESGDDYLYPASLFVRVQLSEAARKAVRRAA